MDLSFLKNAGIQVTPNASLARYTTFQLGGPCQAMVECLDAGQMTFAVAALRSLEIPFMVMGFGSNILVSDRGINAVIVRYTSEKPFIRRQANTLAVDAGSPLDGLAEYAVNAGLEGLTAFSGIPGTVGGAIAGNAGAYGVQVTDHMTRLTLLRPDNSIHVLPGSAIHFAYRDSELKHNNSIILHAEFQLADGDSVAMQKKRAEVIQTRESKHGRWQETPCAGSFFRNVEPTSKAGPRQSAGWFIEQAGGKDLNIGGAHAYHQHGNIITHDPGATAEDVYELTNKIRDMVKARFNIDLVREVRLLGEFKGASRQPGFW